MNATQIGLFEDKIAQVGSSQPNSAVSYTCAVQYQQVTSLNSSRRKLNKNTNGNTKQLTIAYDINIRAVNMIEATLANATFLNTIDSSSNELTSFMQLINLDVNAIGPTRVLRTPFPTSVPTPNPSLSPTSS